MHMGYLDTVCSLYMEHVVPYLLKPTGFTTAVHHASIYHSNPCVSPICATPKTISWILLYISMYIYIYTYYVYTAYVLDVLIYIYNTVYIYI